eukprot:COSAG01_NODE_65826_length_272_cov_0.595376_1_plen_40_part_01
MEIEIDGCQHSFIDGGVKANNPIRVALKESQQIWKGRRVG